MEQLEKLFCLLRWFVVSKNIVKGRNPKDVWAFVQRTCGVCTTTHAIASIRAVEGALKITVPPNAEMVRNIMLGALYLHDHVVHFYHLHAFDWVDVVSGLSARSKNIRHNLFLMVVKSSPDIF